MRVALIALFVAYAAALPAPFLFSGDAVGLGGPGLGGPAFGLGAAHPFGLFNADAAVAGPAPLDGPAPLAGPGPLPLDAAPIAGPGPIPLDGPAPAPLLPEGGPAPLLFGADPAPVAPAVAAPALAAPAFGFGAGFAGAHPYFNQYAGYGAHLGPIGHPGLLFAADAAAAPAPAPVVPEPAPIAPAPIGFGPGPIGFGGPGPIGFGGPGPIGFGGPGPIGLGGPGALFASDAAPARIQQGPAVTGQIVPGATKQTGVRATGTKSTGIRPLAAPQPLHHTFQPSTDPNPRTVVNHRNTHRQLITAFQPVGGPQYTSGPQAPTPNAPTQLIRIPGPGPIVTGNAPDPTAPLRNSPLPAIPGSTPEAQVEASLSLDAAVRHAGSVDRLVGPVRKVPLPAPVHLGVRAPAPAVAAENAKASASLDAANRHIATNRFGLGYGGIGLGYGAGIGYGAGFGYAAAPAAAPALSFAHDARFAGAYGGLPVPGPFWGKDKE